MSEPAPPAFVTQLRAELVRAAGRRRTRGRPLGVALGALVATVVALVLTRPLPAAADVQVEVHEGRVVVTLHDLEHRARHIEAVLRGIGLDASVAAAPVGPSEVGRFVGGTDAAGLHPQLERVGAGPVTFAGFSVPVGWQGRLDLHVGRPARPGEAYAAFSDALAPGEPLACRRLLGVRADRALASLAGTELDVGLQAGPSGMLRPADIPGGPYADWTVTGVDAASPQRVVVRLGPPRVAPAAPATAPGCEG